MVNDQPTPSSPIRQPATGRRREDVTGQRFTSLVAVRFLRFENKRTIWLFRCDCGKELEVRIDMVKSGNTRSCGCIRTVVARGLIPTRHGHTLKAATDLTGRRFGRLTVSAEADKRLGIKHRRWSCLCDCGKSVTIEQRSLIIGKAQSCGCIQREKAAEQAALMGAGNATHGMTDSPEWLAWKNMIARCTDPGQKSYPHYGGRGIAVCDRWLGEDGFVNFYVDLGARPSPGHSLGRIDNDGNYCPENCRWETIHQQARNRSNNRTITLDGATKTMSEWAEDVGLTHCSLHNRLKYGWPVELALTTPVGVVPEELEKVRLPVDPDVRLKAHAHAMVYQALKRGKLVRPPHCQHPGCDTPTVEGHHHRGYEREHWLDVVWLCRRHHEEADRLLVNAAHDYPSPHPPG